MSGIKLNSSGDMDLTNGNATLTSGSEATGQRISQRLKMFLAEWFLDKTRGVPYFEQILVKSPNAVVVDAVLKREIITDPAVLALQEFSVDLNTTLRLMTVTFKVLTDDGPVDLSVIVP